MRCKECGQEMNGTPPAYFDIVIPSPKPPPVMVRAWGREYRLDARPVEIIYLGGDKDGVYRVRYKLPSEEG